MGTAAVQLARHSGAHVTAVCNTKNVELVRSLGADEVIDYEREDFTKNGKTYDVIFDAVGMHSYRRCRRSLAPDGMYIETDLGFMWHVPLLALTSKRVTLGVAKYRKEDVVLLKELVEAGAYRAVIDRTYPLEERGRRDAVRRDRAEDRQRRADRGGAVRAVVHDRYGPPEVLRVDEVERPSPKDDEVLVRVHATTVTRTDIHMRQARPILWRFMLGFLRPRRRILGLEFAGVVEEVGAAATEFGVGERVFGLRNSSHAEYVCVREHGLIARIPDGLSFEQASRLRRHEPGPRRSPHRDRSGRGRGSSCSARPARSGRLPSSSRRTSARTSRPCATRRTSSSSARSAPTR